VIKSFGNDFADAAWRGKYAKGIPNDVMRVAARKLLQVDAAVRLDDLRMPPGNRLEALKGGLRGRHSIRVNDQWRIVFVWRNGDAHDVSVVDYHR
jgi:proteic killer suppression protein